jgi:hypothetical protein
VNRNNLENFIFTLSPKEGQTAARGRSVGELNLGSDDHQTPTVTHELRILRQSEKKAVARATHARLILFDRCRTVVESGLLSVGRKEKLARPSLKTELVDKHLPNACGKHQKDVIGRF